MRRSADRLAQRILWSVLWATIALGLSALGLSVASAAPPQPARVDPAEARSQRVRSRIFSVPKPYRYDEETDEVLHYSNVWSLSHSSAPGDPYAYYGNRLRQFLYMGPLETGGIYEALETHHRLRGLEPENYRYRGLPR